MTVVTLVAAVLVTTSLGAARTAGVAGVAVLLSGAPVLAIPAGLIAVVVLGLHRLRASGERARSAQEDLAALAEVTAIGLTGGLGIQAALRLAAQGVGGPIEAEVHSVLRQARVGGLAVTMGSASGTGRELYRAIGRAAATGAPLVDTVARLADETHADLAAARLQAVRRLPVTLLFPLTLLILPGFLLLAVAPALLEAFGRLEM